MFYLSPENDRYFLRVPFTYGDIQYSAAGATHETFTALGFTQVTIDPRPSDAFYYVTGPDDTGSYTTTDRDLADIKANFVHEQKVQARRLLSYTDHLILAFVEDNSNTVPAAVATFRAAVRTASTARCSEVNAAASIAALETLINAPEQLYDESTDTYSVNPAGLTSFPEVTEEVQGYYY